MQLSKHNSMIPANVKLTTFSYSFENMSNSSLKLLVENMDTLVLQKKIIIEHTILRIGSTTAKIE